MNVTQQQHDDLQNGLIETATRIEKKRRNSELRIVLLSSLLTFLLVLILGLWGILTLRGLIDNIENQTLENRRQTKMHAEQVEGLLENVQGRIIEKAEVRTLQREIRRLRQATIRLNQQLKEGLEVRAVLPEASSGG